MSSASTMAPACLAASVPFMPMATPTSACFSAGASLTPSPVMATTSPLACSARTRRSLCSGLARANTRASATAWRMAASSISSSSGPVIALMSSPMPSCRAMALAVTPWSPVIITTRIPAARHWATARIASSRGGSMMPTRPSRVSPLATSACSRSCLPALSRHRAKASTRRPARACASIWLCQCASSSARSTPSASSCCEHMARMRSGAPLTNTSLPASQACSVAINRCSDSNGITSSRGRSTCTTVGESPAFIARVSSAPSVGSPASTQCCSFSCRLASLHSAAASTSAAAAGEWAANAAASTADPCSSRLPVGAYPAPSTSSDWPAQITSCTVISLRVRVPVLSEQITVTEPSASTAGSRRIAPRCVRPCAAHRWPG